MGTLVEEVSERVGKGFPPASKGPSDYAQERLLLLTNGVLSLARSLALEGRGSPIRRGPLLVPGRGKGGSGGPCLEKRSVSRALAWARSRLARCRSFLYWSTTLAASMPSSSAAESTPRQMDPPC